jgi:esterase/lipase superfamily enzyme
MRSWRKFIVVVCATVVLNGQTAGADPVSDIKSYVAAVEAGDWGGAAAAADRLLGYPADSLQISAAELIQMLSVVAEASERAGQVVRAIALYQKLIAEIEARDGPTSYTLVAPLGKLAELLAAQGRFEESASAYDDAVILSEAELGDDNSALLPIYQARRLVDRKRLAAAMQNADQLDMLKGRLAREDAAIERLGAVAKTRSFARGEAPFQLVTIHYGTNRAPTGRPEPTQFYSDKRGPLRLGVATVSVPKLRSIGEIPLPQIWRGEFRPNAAKHFVLTKIAPFGSIDEFTASARAQIGKSERREALVFIHGYNSDFENSIFRAAQLAVDLNIDGAVFMYSWPSKGSLFGYVADSAQVIRPMVRGLQEFLDIIVQKTGAEQVHVVAHSMGNRYLLDALELMAREVPADARKPVFQQMVFAAPDVDADDFTDRIKELGWMGHRMTLYASSKDRALYLSSIINGGYRRAGDAATPVIVAGLDTVDTTEVSGQGLGHGDYAERALDDFRAIVWLSLKPRSRCQLISRNNPIGGDYWQLTNDEIKSCPFEAFRTAISLVRRFGRPDALTYLHEKINAAREAKDTTGAAAMRQYCRY